MSVRHRSVDFCVTQKRWIKMSNWGGTDYTKTCKPFVLNHMNQLNSSSLRAILLEKEKKIFFQWNRLLVTILSPSLGGQQPLAGRGGVRCWQPLCGGRWRQWWLQVDSLVEKLVADQHDQGEETQLEVAGRVKSTSVTCEIDPFIYCSYSVLLDTHYSFVGVFASLALMMNRGKRMENKQPLHRKQR